ncbi:MAG: hypothetical protein AAB250_12840, partial [Bdellovibrionota bacterium]
MARTQNHVAPPLRPDRIRKIDPGGFAFIPNAFLRAGFFGQLTEPERSLYVLYVLLGDRNGVSYLIHANIATLLDVGVDEYLEVRQSLEDKDLIATADFGTRVQVLSLPCRPVAPPQRVRTAPMAQAPT